jgi:protein TonB
MTEHFSWRHVLAFLVTIVAVWLIWSGTRLVLTEPVHKPQPNLMHISLASPPAPVVPPKVTPKPPKPVASKTPSQRTPVETPSHTPGPPVVENAPVSAQASAPPAPAAPPAQPPDSAAVNSSYAARVRAAIEAQKHYPMSKDARLEQPRGTVGVWVELTRDGTIVDAGIEESAGSILDRQALETVRRATYPPFPAGAYPGQSQQRFAASLNFIPPS